jgi:hypothetical protein
VKRKGGTKKPKAQKQPTISISLGQPQPQMMPRLAPTFQSSISTPLSQQRVAPPPTGVTMAVPSRMARVAREIETQTEPSRREEMGTQTVQLAGRISAEEMARYSREREPGETMSEYRIRTYRDF